MDLTAALRLLGLPAALALVLLGWIWARQRHADRHGQLAALAGLTLFLTFDLIVFGSFTRLTDSGLGCPDWPGCYGHASPIGAHGDIHAAQAAQPTGPVTFSKAWIEMVHRYLAMTVGALIVVLTAAAWRWRARLPLSPWWPTATLGWVIVQGLFGMWTVTWRLQPAIVTLHLLGGMALLALLAVQRELLIGPRVRWPRGAVGVVAGAGLVLVLQIASGAWVSSNYAVLACSGYPACNGQWWPAMDFASGFTLWRELGRDGDGGFLPFEALVAIHMVHRWFVVVAAIALLALAAWLRTRGLAPRAAAAIVALLLLQVASGLSNVVLGWPLVAALVHVAGAAALVGVVATLLARAARGAAAGS
jgi:cytochrome c oxidase assembly protein subunit 15